MQVEDCFEIGVVVRPHGIAGEFKVKFDVKEIRDYEHLTSVYLHQEDKLMFFLLEYMRIQHASTALMAFKGIDNRDAAAALKGATLLLPMDQLPPLEAENSFYYFELVGVIVEDERYGMLGRILRVQEMPAQDLLVMSYKGKEVLIPLLDDTVIHFDRESKTVHTRLPEGLLEVYLDINP